MKRELRDAYARAEADDDVWTIVVTANGRAFCSGADVEVCTRGWQVPHEGGTCRSSGVGRAARGDAAVPYDGEADHRGVNGLCCGAGLDLVTTGDIVIASERAEFFDPHVSIGLVSGPRDGAARPRAPAQCRDAGRATGPARTHRRAACVRPRPRDRGGATRRARARARELAETVNRNAPLAVRGTRLGDPQGPRTSAYEAELLAEAYRERNLHTDDAAEGPRAFLENRDPNWEGR